MLLAADHDDRVVPSHSYKFAATLQAAQGCDRPILLRVAINASHLYASRQAQIDERTDMWAFVVASMNVGFATGELSPTSDSWPSWPLDPMGSRQQQLSGKGTCRRYQFSLARITPRPEGMAQGAY
jgi:hypothetical protein